MLEPQDILCESVGFASLRQFHGGLNVQELTKRKSLEVSDLLLCVVWIFILDPKLRYGMSSIFSFLFLL